jgi:hypothetical protein
MSGDKSITSLQQIPFHDDTLYAVVDERTGKEYVVPKPMVDIFGLLWHGQLVKLKKNKLFSKGIQTICLPSAGGMQETVVLERRLVHAWLLSIDVNRVAPEYQDKLLRYQEECADVLDAHFSKQALAQTPVFSSLECQERELALLDRYVAFLSSINQFTPRDSLMVADQARNLMSTGQRLLTGGTVQHGFSVAERVAQLGYHLTRTQQARHLPKLGKRIASEWRNREHTKPQTEPRFVDGATREVAWYPDTAASWADVIIQTYLAQYPECQRTPNPFTED